MVRMTINKIRIDEKREGQVIVLKEKDGERLLPIIIGIPEIVAIKRKLSGIRAPRPMTHDLIADLIKGLGATVDKVIINKLAFNTFYAKIIISQNGKKLEIDARPSDSIALAIRVEAPLFAEEDVLNQISA